MSLKNRGWNCNQCGTRNPRGVQKCPGCGMKFSKNLNCKKGKGRRDRMVRWTANTLRNSPKYFRAEREKDDIIRLQ